MIHIKLFEKTGEFAENKDLAREIRINKLIPALENNQEIVLDFENVQSVTQSFIHALISDLFRKYGNEVLDKISFKSCNETVQKMINIVIDYMQESV
jgi:STAS-like domain of unknown function (DUF4325)